MQFEKHSVYHIYNRSINKELLFRSDGNYSYFMQKFNHYLGVKVDVLAYCLMPNHFHFLVRAIDESEVIENGFKNFFIAYAKAFNSANNRAGGLFQAKYKKDVVADDNYFTNVIAYIHLNPVKAGLCNSPEQWKYSSYNAFLSTDVTKIRRDEVLKWFSTKEEFIAFHKQYRGDHWVSNNLPD